ncbi:L-rhamnose mutarotase [Pinibacter aurantiacus]|uniref:L-rhamnose mutarotase n=1 Tax=Pinibacter aurantiacus TaxID=2851599 RepID=A0A9E2SA01_9BACT|nr:L-rhamnose mutarotase [Pinibacter aurantiacus]MBV4357487.1 L-rhamnose mutarotase [Pinibacter aurantiacus]
MNSFYNRLLAIGLAIVIMSGCKEKNTQQQLVEKVFVVNITPDSSKMSEYLAYHKQVWPEVEAGFKKAGYKKITLYRFDHLLVMNITVPADADLNEMGKVAESYSPRCAEWNKIMSHYQVGVAGTAAGQTWVEAKPFYSFGNQ